MMKMTVDFSSRLNIRKNTDTRIQGYYHSYQAAMLVPFLI